MNKSVKQIVLLLVAFLFLTAVAFIVIRFIRETPRSPVDLSAVPVAESDVAEQSGDSSPETIKKDKKIGEVKDWGLRFLVGDTENMKIKSTKISGNDLVIETLGYEQLRNAGYLPKDTFDICTENMNRMSRIAYSETVDQVNLTPWYPSRPYHEAYSTRVGDYYYFFKNEGTDPACEIQASQYQSVIVPLMIEQKKLLNALTGINN